MAAIVQAESRSRRICSLETEYNFERAHKACGGDPRTFRAKFAISSLIWHHGSHGKRTAVRIASSPNLRIAAGLRLAALLSIVGHQVFRRWISHVQRRCWCKPTRYRARASAVEHPALLHFKTKIKLAELEAVSITRFRHLAIESICNPLPCCVFGFWKRFQILVPFVDERLFCTYPITALA